MKHGSGIIPRGQAGWLKLAFIAGATLYTGGWLRESAAAELAKDSKADSWTVKAARFFKLVPKA